MIAYDHQALEFLLGCELKVCETYAEQVTARTLLDALTTPNTDFKFSNALNWIQDVYRKGYAAGQLDERTRRDKELKNLLNIR